MIIGVYGMSSWRQKKETFICVRWKQPLLKIHCYKSHTIIESSSAWIAYESILWLDNLTVCDLMFNYLNYVLLSTSLIIKP